MSGETSRIQNYLLDRYGEEPLDDHGPRHNAWIIGGSAVAGIAAGSVAHGEIFAGADGNLAEISTLKTEVATLKRADDINRENHYQVSNSVNSDVAQKLSTKIGVKEQKVPLGGHYTETIGQISGIGIAVLVIAGVHRAVSHKATLLLEQAREQKRKYKSRDII